ncbi:MAG: CHASE2 domain-containing protein [Burkholderiales bacterium]|nr:CHASE2 domain-containing protein [Burkholderiales bacterium]
MAASPAMRHVARTEWLVLGGFLTLLAFVLGLSNGLGRADATLYDATLGLTRLAPAEDVVIVAIDDASLAALGRWPWSREVHARLVDRLADAKPRAVGFDLIFSEAEPAADARLAEALKRIPAVLPVLVESRAGQMRINEPVVQIAASAAALGHIHLEVDRDGIARSAFLREGPGNAARRYSHLSLALREVGKGNAEANPPGLRNPHPDPSARWQRDFWVHFPFAGPAGSVPRVSYADVLEGRVDAARLTDKTVLVGATAAGLGDAYPTPVTGQSRLMPGVEINANLYTALSTGRTIIPLPRLVNAIINALAVLLVLVALYRLSPRRALAVVALTLLAMPVLLWFMLGQGITMAPAAGMLCVAAAYPLWSWRRLEATMHYLGEEFRRLAAEPRIMPEQTSPAILDANPLEARIHALAGAADRLRQARRFVSDTLASLPNATLVADRDGRILLANRAAAQLFAGAAALEGSSVAEVAKRLSGRTPMDPAPDWEALKQLAEVPPHDETPRALECVTGDQRSLLARCARVSDAAGEGVGWIVSFAEITELRNAERAREEVLAFLSHDMRSPQSSIIALLELHELDPDDNPKEDVHRRIEQYARRTLSLSEQFLQLARAETKAHEPTIEDLGALAEEAVDEVWTAAEQKSIKVAVTWDGEPLPVRADKPLLSRALINLLTNAIKYSPEKTRVEVRVGERRDGDAVRHVCTITDQGYGISKENQAKLFQRFQRFSEPGQPRAQGAGLGMAFVKTVIEKHGGDIEVQSEPGRGSTFTVLLPPVGDAPL